ncbi:MAG: hypothetical protein CL947_01805 [Epsilonproteobacteria bacterium]|nr:hypothetical protein [Campylobacterota bacterium]|tara:strand:- start:51 stop:599 length:549 start_codon:yes stop_codon:yes gene_type:complete
MKNMYYIIACISMTLVGSLFYLQQESWIIITSPFDYDNKINPIAKKYTSYKTVTLYAWNQNHLKQEVTDIIYSDNVSQNLKQLINSWFLFLDDEDIMTQETYVESVILSPSKQEAFISLNQIPFEGSWSTYQKLFWIEGMLTTIKNNKIPITAIRLLVHHQPLQDDHLNFAIPWPITGFLQK